MRGFNKKIATLLFVTSISILALAGKLQNEDFKTQAQITAAGGTIANFLNDTKIYVTAKGLNTTLNAAITANALSSSLPSGAVLTMASTSCPSATVAMDGSSYLRTGTYANLYAAIGTTYGAADSTHFNVPDARGLFIRAAGTNGTLTWSNGTAVSSASIGTLVADQFQGHYHYLYDPSHNHSQNPHSHSFTQYTNSNTGLALSNSVAFLNASTNNTANTTATNIAAVTGVLVQYPTGDGTNGSPLSGAETRPVNLAMTMCIHL